MSNNIIQTMKNGPYLDNGEIELKDADGKIIPVKDMPCHLCRCGQLGNKPFCDGTHVKAGFKG
jgi:CDGSH-type Zn-finger protein